MENAYKKITLFFLFTVLMLIKVSAFHVYSHQTDENNKIENCSICDIVSLNQQNQFLVSEETNAPNSNLVFVPLEKNFKSVPTTFFDDRASYLCCRPPPVVA